MCVPVIATENEGSNTYTITAPATTHQYEIYQIFTGDLSNGKLSNIKWGVNGTGETGHKVEDSVLKALADVNIEGKTDIDKLNVIQQYVTLSNPVKTITNGQVYQVTAGYYLIKDKEKDEAGNNIVSGADSYTNYIVEVVGNIEISPKSSVPSFEKKLKDINDTTDTEYTGWQDSADYDIGDFIPFKLEGTVANNYTSYKGKYYFTFHDVEEQGLTFQSKSVKVYIGTSETPLDSGKYKVVTSDSGLSDGCTFEVIFPDLKNIEGVTNGTKIRVEYTSELNDKAVFGNRGNVNKARLEFSNNPNEEQQGDDKPSTGETPWDNVIVFTYKVVVNKKDQDKKDLSGAGFKLEKEIKATGDNKSNSWKTISEIKTEGLIKFEFKGLDDGKYRLTETKTPEGYNTIDPIIFTVTAEHNITWEKGDADRETILISLSGTAESGEITFAPNEDKTELATTVINKKGSTLPTTGGIGTTIFYVVGVVLMLGAGVLLVTKKRMNSNH